MKKRILSEEEKKLWKLVTEGDRKLGEKQVKVTAAPKGYKAAPLPDAIPAKPVRRLPAAPAQGRYADIDKNTADKFRKGHYPIDATLDLHGMTSEKARAALLGFIAAQHRRGHRCLLIVTGKGRSGEGVLKAAFPRWLAEDALSPMILAFDAAKARHGGSGAFYVLLRRKR